MSKFWAKLRFRNEKNAEHLITAFFKDFNPQSSIVIRGREAKLEIVFRQPPMAIIKAINYCEVVELNYGKNLKEYKEDETIYAKAENDSEQENAKEESSKPTIQPDAEKEESKQDKQVEPENENSEQEVTENENSEQTEEVTIEVVKLPELEEIASKATSFEDFVKLVAEWLEMDKRKEFFENVATTSAEVAKIAWKDLEKALKDKGVTYSRWDKNCIVSQVSKKLGAKSITMLPLLNEIAQYKEYSFKKIEEESDKENLTEQVAEETANENEENAEEFSGSIEPKPRVKMECMPEIREFEETLASVDKTSPIEERVRYVLETMGLNKIPTKEQKQILEMATTAVKKERMAFDIIFLDANIPIEQTMTVRMTFSDFINNFAQKYESDREVKLLTFLSELQKIIMLDSEIEDFSDFTD